MDVSSMRRVIEHLLMVPDLAVVSSQHSSQERSGNSLSAAEKVPLLNTLLQRFVRLYARCWNLVEPA